ncbi:type II toxin-antitoxin system ParD family antitoxin [Singulisphaera sp. Ch08]|uniref:Type II toxin-antitoxin system ParD family antitoxin n=1 Tax=Singulisphaera sp. Ch08 TaxID=3120278 RepID=A0AAU7C8J4_9BACT
MTIQLTEDRKRFVLALVQGGRYASESEVVNEALRLLEQQDLVRAEEKRRFEALVVQGIESGPSTPMTPGDWDEIEREGERIVAARKARKDR